MPDAGSPVSEKNSSRNCLINRNRSYSRVPPVGRTVRRSPIWTSGVTKNQGRESPPAVYQTVSLGDSVNKERVVAHQSHTPATHHCPPGDFAHPRMHLPGYPVRLLRLPLGVPLPRLSPLRRLRSSPLLHGPAFAR